MDTDLEQSGRHEGRFGRIREFDSDDNAAQSNQLEPGFGSKQQSTSIKKNWQTGMCCRD